MSNKKPPAADENSKVVTRTLDYIERRPEAQAQLLLHFRWAAEINAAYEVVPEATCTPPGSLLSSMLRAWHEGTSIPLAMPYWIILGYVSGHLSRHEVLIRLPDGSSVQPKLWQTVIAPAGCGKTWTEKQIEGVFGTESKLDLSSAVSTAAFVSALARQTRGVWTRDEWGQFLRQLETPSSPLAGVRDVLLRVHEGASVGRECVRGEPVIAVDPCMSIIGITVDSTYEEIISAESLLDGFASRFAICYSREDPLRPWWECPWWILPPDGASEWAARWQAIAEHIQPQYRVTEAAFAYFFTIYRREGRRVAHDMPEAFFRRVFARWHVLALLLHVVSGNESPELDVASYEVAYRALNWSLHDGARLLNRVTGGAFRRMIADATRWREKHPNAVLTRSALIAGVRSIPDARSAEFILRVLSEGTNGNSLRTHN